MQAAQLSASAAVGGAAEAGYKTALYVRVDIGALEVSGLSPACHALLLFRPHLTLLHCVPRHIFISQIRHIRQQSVCVKYTGMSVA